MEAEERTDIPLYSEVVQSTVPDYTHGRNNRKDRRDCNNQTKPLECKLCAEQYGLQQCRLWQRSPDTWIERIDSPSSISLDDIDVVPYMHFCAAFAGNEDTRFYDLAWSLCCPAPLLDPDDVHQKDMINYELAERQYPNTFHDLRSAGKARLRHRTELDKYFSFRAQQGGVDRGMLDQEVHKPCRSSWLGWYGELPADTPVVRMSKRDVWREAQEWPRPPKMHRRTKGEYKDGKTLKWRKRQYERRQCTRDIYADEVDLWYYDMEEYHAEHSALWDWECADGTFVDQELAPVTWLLEDLLGDDDFVAYRMADADVCQHYMFDQDVDWTLVPLHPARSSVDASGPGTEWSWVESEGLDECCTSDVASQWSMISR